MISTGELKKGVAIELDGELWQILDYHHIKMGRGSAQVRITLRNIKRGQTVERSFQAGTKWPRASMEKRPVQFLYRDGDDYHFMDNDTYDQFILTTDQLGETAQYLKDGMTLDRTSYQGETIGVELPVTVDLDGRRDRARLRRRHADRRAQAGDDRDGPRRHRSRSSSSRATRSGSTRGPGSTRPGSSDDGRAWWHRSAARPLRGGVPRPRDRGERRKPGVPDQPRQRAGRRVAGAAGGRVALDRVDRPPRRVVQGDVRRLRLRIRDARVGHARGRTLVGGRCAARRGRPLADRRARGGSWPT